MPAYEYIEIKSGRDVEFVVPIKHRDSVPGHRRRTVPRRINVLRGAPDPTSAAVATPRGFRQLEESIGAERIERESGFSIKEIKETWEF